jgi:hypothetical protein
VRSVLTFASEPILQTDDQQQQSGGAYEDYTFLNSPSKVRFEAPGIIVEVGM